ncbi:MAG: hypothetical protein A3G34_17600 [Candidatus Lindowbacteria bacterium RIFCSPLOWO2_12_FULL_62_27]|nr:MAG: hypothetical protein A3G34_17600 [Candidatus Lindowbacteria bacterium RIFCSPLOWO2_12_FULL_62_27]OGH56747.1 MAG: hypothetical protein A3I06_12775 [Candidatus Lindowbacteria bacterium RIFCSPLOWO2_02_FULL_62_12]
MAKTQERKKSAGPRLRKTVLRLAAQPDALKVVRNTILKEAGALRIHPEELYSMVLAVDEACANVIRHAYKDGPARPMIIEIEITSRQMSIVIRDSGQAFDFGEYPRIPVREAIAQRAERGYGIQIIKSVVDRWEHTRTKSGENRLRLIKYFHPAGS